MFAVSEDRIEQIEPIGLKIICRSGSSKPADENRDQPADPRNDLS